MVVVFRELTRKKTRTFVEYYKQEMDAALFYCPFIPEDLDANDQGRDVGARPS